MGSRRRARERRGTGRDRYTDAADDGRPGGGPRLPRRPGSAPAPRSRRGGRRGRRLPRFGASLLHHRRDRGRRRRGDRIVTGGEAVATFPHVRVSGGPRERGRSYGEQARDRISTSIDAYEQVFRAYAGWSWEEVRREAAGYQAPIAAFDERYVEEMRGIAEGAGVDLEDILGINVRTEVMFAAKARAAERAGAPGASRGSGPRQGECTAFAVVPEASASGHTLIGQNWDWLLH